MKCALVMGALPPSPVVQLTMQEGKVLQHGPQDVSPSDHLGGERVRISASAVWTVPPVAALTHAICTQGR